MTTFYRLIKSLSDELLWEAGRQYKETIYGFHRTIDDCMRNSWDVQANNFIAQVTTDTPLSQIECRSSESRLASFSIVKVQSIQSWIILFPSNVIHQMHAEFIRHVPAERQDKIMWHKALEISHPEWILHPDGVKWLQQYHTHQRLAEVEKEIATLQAELQKKKLEQQILQSLIEPNFQF